VETIFWGTNSASSGTTFVTPNVLGMGGTILNALAAGNALGSVTINNGSIASLGGIVGATSSLFGKENVVGIKANFDATEALGTTAAKITPDSMTNVKQLAAEVQKFNMELKTMATVTASEPLMNLVKAITGQTNAMTDGTKDKTIVLKVGEREFGKIVLDTINKKGNIDTAVKSTSTVT
jgi:hypothetical protein